MVIAFIGGIAGLIGLCWLCKLAKTRDENALAGEADGTNGTRAERKDDLVFDPLNDLDGLNHLDKQIHRNLTYSNESHHNPNNIFFLDEDFK
jgi:hypothetical protein